MNRLKSYYHVAKHSTLHLLGVNPRLTSVRCMLRLAHSLAHNLFFYCKLHDAARAILSNRVCSIVTVNKSPEIFDRLSDVELLRIFLFGLPDDQWRF